MHIPEMQSEIAKKPPFYKTKVFEVVLRKSAYLRREYLSSGINVLTNSLKVSDVIKADSFQHNLSRIRGKIGK